MPRLAQSHIGTRDIGKLIGHASTIRKARSYRLRFIIKPYAQPETRPRARGLKVPFEGTPGPLNAITHVAGVEIGYTMLISGEGTATSKASDRFERALLPSIVAAARTCFLFSRPDSFLKNGNGEMTRTA
jgi:hypothetical protein